VGYENAKNRYIGHYPYRCVLPPLMSYWFYSDESCGRRGGH